MFLRLLYESLVRQRSRKALASAAILLGTTCVTAMLALATTIGDRIHQELAVYGANIIVTPKAANLDVKIGGIDIHPATGNAYLHESDLNKLKTIFWANNITGISPELPVTISMITHGGRELKVNATGMWFNHPFGNTAATSGAPQLHPTWKLVGSWPSTSDDIVLGKTIALTLHKQPGDVLYLPLATAAPNTHAHVAEGPLLHVTGVVDTASPLDEQLILPLEAAQRLANLPDLISRVEITARTKPEDAFARVDPDTLPPAQREIWYCRPYANSIAYQIREAIPGADAQQVRKVEQSEGTVLRRISGLMALISVAAMLAASFAVAAAMANAVLERRAEIGLMRSLGASRTAIALLFYAENSIIACIAGLLGYLAGSALAFWLGTSIFAGEATTTAPLFNPVLLPVTLGLAILVSIAGASPSILEALRTNPSTVLRADA